MEQISFYLDEHIHRSVANGLRRRGVNLLTVQEAGKNGAGKSGGKPAFLTASLPS